MQPTDRPIPEKLILQASILLLVVFAILAGYYQSKLYIWRTNHLKVLDKLNTNTTKEVLEKEFVEVK
jgi:hypothetical protein